MRELLMCLFWIVIGVLIGMATYEGSVMRDCEQMHMLQADQLEALRQQLKEGQKDSALSRFDAECLRIGKQIQRAAGELPEHYEVEIMVEQGAGSVTLFNPDGDRKDCGASDIGLSYQIEAAIDAAIEESKS